MGGGQGEEAPDPNRELNAWVDRHIVEDARGYRHCDAELTAWARRRQIGIPREFEFATFETFQMLTPELQRCRRACEGWTGSWDDRGREHGLCIYGPTGTGKTHLGVAAVKAVVAMGWRPRYINYRRLIEDLRSSGWEANPVDYWVEVDVMMIDDLGCVSASQALLDKLGTILALRMEHFRPTVITSNLEFPGESGRIRTGFRSVLDDRLIDRMHYFYSFVPFVSGRSWRKRMAEA